MPARESGGGWVRGLAATAASVPIVLGALASPAHALPSLLPPEVVVGGGWTMAVNGEPGTGGAAGLLAAEWPFAARWSFGGALFAQDMGTATSELHDPNTGALLGTVASTHRWSYGLEWRGETAIRETSHTRWHWNGGFGYARQERDERGTVNDAVSGITASTGVTALWLFSHGQGVGATLQYRHQFVDTESSPDRATRCVSATLEWRWSSIPKD